MAVRKIFRENCGNAGRKLPICNAKMTLWQHGRELGGMEMCNGPEFVRHLHDITHKKLVFGKRKKK